MSKVFNSRNGLALRTLSLLWNAFLLTSKALFLQAPMRQSETKLPPNVP
jgi:hypothetical protein